MQDVRKKTPWRASRLALVTGVTVIVAAGAGVAQTYEGWSVPVSAEVGSDPLLNTQYNDGCPILSPDGLTLYMATNRPGSAGGLTPAGAQNNQNIWIAQRETTTSGWGAPEPLPAPVNGSVDDFCPTPVRGKGLFFVSRRDDPNGDIYFTRQKPNGDWEEPVRLGPNINNPHEEWSPSYFEDEQGRPVLYFSRHVPGSNNHDIYQSVNWGPAELAPGDINGPTNDARPNVRKDGREIVWDSNRQGVNSQDVWTSTRASTSDPWGPPQHLVQVSSTVADTRASLSWDGTILMVGSGRSQDVNGVPNLSPGVNDIYVSTRSKVPGGGN